MGKERCFVGVVTAWFLDKRRQRIREEPLPDVEILAADLESLSTAVFDRAEAIYKSRKSCRPSCQAVRVTTKFCTGEGVTGRFSRTAGDRSVFHPGMMTDD